MSEYEVGRFDEFVDGAAINRRINGRELVFIRIGNSLYVLDDRCSHEEFPLSLGEVDVANCSIECERHGASFHLSDGTPASFPATQPVPTHDVTLRDGNVYVEL